MDNALRGLIFSKYRTVSEFADAMGWSRTKAARIASGKQQPKKADMEALIDKLKIPPTSIAPVFFGSVFTE